MLRQDHHQKKTNSFFLSFRGGGHGLMYQYPDALSQRPFFSYHSLERDSGARKRIRID
jgi:hypothetical protein